MLRYLLSSRWVQSGLAFFVLVVGGILIHSWYVLRSTETQLEQNSRLSPGLEKHKETSVAQEVMAPADTGVSGFVNPPDENTAPPITSEKEALPRETEPFDSAGVFLPDKTVSEESPTKEIPVSPYGFGPYPELPDGWPDTTFPAPSADHELQQRVRIKLISLRSSCRRNIHGKWFSISGYQRDCLCKMEVLLEANGKG